MSCVINSSGASNNASNGTGSAPGSGSGNNQASFVSQMLQNNPELLSQLGGGAVSVNLLLCVVMGHRPL